MVRAINPNRTRDYVPVADRDLPAAEQTVFELRPFTVGERQWFLDRGASLMDPKTAKMGEWEALVVRAGLAGWRNLIDHDGGQVPYAEGNPPKGGPGRRPSVTDEALARVPPEIRAELAAEIQRAELLGGDADVPSTRDLSEDDEGN